jgi:DNA-binding transcriptional regulator YhcF (GntR family)
MSLTFRKTAASQPVLMSDKVRRVVEKTSAVLQGKFKPGDRFWTVDQLARHCRVSRVTANLGVRELAKQGVLSSNRGQGIFVLRVPEAHVEHARTRSLEHAFGHGLESPTASTIRIGTSDFPGALEFYSSVGRQVARQLAFTQMRAELFALAPTAELDPDELPDVIIADVRSLRLLADTGLLMELTPWVQYDEHVDLKTFFPETVRDLTGAGKRFALPFCFSLDLLITRQPKPRSQISVKELLAIRPAKNSFVLNLPVPAHWMQACGVPVDTEGWFDLAHPTLRTALEAYAELFHSERVLRTGLFSNEGLLPQDAFLSGRLLYYSTGTFRLFDLRRQGKHGLRPIRFDPSLCPKVVRGTVGIAIKATTPEPKIAWTVLRAFLSEAAQIEYGKFGANLPAREAAAHHRNFLDANGGDWSGVPSLVKESVSTVDKHLGNAEYLRHVLAPGLRPYLECEIPLDECIERIQKEQALSRAVSLAA